MSIPADQQLTAYQPPATPAIETYAVTLRDYQADGVAVIREAFREHKRLCYVLPTGGGKTVIFAFITYHAMRKGSRTLILAHRIEIVEQISAALTLMGVPHGMLVAGARHIPDDLIQVGMVQTVANRLAKLAPPDFIVIDECHHAVAGTWAKVLDRFKDAYVLGVTATPERLDGRGLREVGFEKLILGPDVGWLIEHGHLARFRYLSADVGARFDDIDEVGGDYNLEQVAARMTATQAIVGNAIAHYRKHLNERSCIAFCATIAHAEQVAASYNQAGIPAASLDGSMHKEVRRAVIEGLRSGALKVVSSCQVISEGFDAPAVGGAQLLRPTKSFAMFRQQIGRCLRPKADGAEAIILDHVMNYTRHGLPDDPHVWDLDSAKRSSRAAPDPDRTRLCKVCGEVFPPAYRGADCGVAGCLFAARPPVGEASGELEEIRRPTPEQAIAWAKGVDLAHGSLRTLLLLAKDNRYKLTQIAAARGYKPGWVYYKAQEYRLRTGWVWGDVYAQERMMV